MTVDPQPHPPTTPTTTADSAAPELAHRQSIKAFGEAQHASLQKSRRRNDYFHEYLTRIVSHQVLPGSRVLDIGCASGDMLAALKPSHGVGIDINGAAIAEARQKHPELTFHEMAAEEVGKPVEGGGETFDYVILSGVLPQLYDVYTALEAIRAVCHDRTRIIVTTFSQLWKPIIRMAEMAGWKARVPDESWIPPAEVRSILGQCDFNIVTQQDAILLPVGIPVMSNLVNRWIAPLPIKHHFDLCTVT